LTIENIKAARELFDAVDVSSEKYMLKGIRSFIANHEQLKEFFDIDMPEGVYYCDDSGIKPLRE